LVRLRGSVILVRLFRYLIRNFEGSTAQRLTESESRFNAYVDIASNWYFEIDKDLRYTFVSKGILAARGTPPDDLIGKTHAEALAQADLAQHPTQQDFIALLARHAEIKDMLLCRSGPGKLDLWGRVSARPMFDANNTFVGYRGVTSDVTDQILAESALKESEVRLDGFFTAAPVGMAIFDEQRRFIKVNNTIADWNGIAIEDHIGKTLDEIFPAFERSKDTDFERIMETGKAAQDTEIVATLPSRPDEEMAWIVSRFPILNAVQKSIGLGTVVTNVTELKRTQAALAEREKQNRLVLDNLPVLIAYIDTDQRFRLVNRTCAEWYGMAEEDIIGKRVSDIPADRYKHFEPTIKRVLAGESVTFEDEVFYPNGQTIFIRSVHVPNFDSAGVVVGYFSLTEDISDRKRVEAEIHQLNAGLEQQVVERTAELETAYKELLQQERLATLGQLTATVSLELRNPLGVMRTSSYVLRKKLDGSDETIANTIDRIERNITRCDRIIDELLDYTRIRQTTLEPVVLDTWLGELLDEMSVPDGVEVVRELATNSLKINIDTDALRRVVINLYDNANQAMTEMEGADSLGARVLTIRALRDGDRAEVAFIDTGVGISDDIQDKVFEPMFSTKGFGIGLGLPTVRKIVEQHGGQIDLVANKDAPGATATLHLPL